jgi:hypothetical protein
LVTIFFFLKNQEIDGENTRNMKKRIRIKRFILSFSLIVVLFIGVSNELALQKALASEKDRHIVGWIEYVTILPDNLRIKAKLDTGAKNSSLNAANIVEFKRGGEAFVRFDIANWNGRTETIEVKVIRIAKIKQHNSVPELRLVIRIGICLGMVYKEVEVNLVNRSNFNYQLLIGRSFLRGDFAVDPSKTFTIKTKCQKVMLDE